MFAYLSAGKGFRFRVSEENRKHYPGLERPPIAEVVCGVVFKPVAEIDPLMLGVYWDSRQADFPKRALEPALIDEGKFDLEPLRMRAFLTSSDEQFVLQLQHDRFFLNWRAVGPTYPRFSERHGPDGLLVRAMREFDQFSAFVEKRTGSKLEPIRTEVSKVDVLRRDTHWLDLDDLALLMPVTGVFAKLQRSEGREVNLRFVERLLGETVVVHIATLRRGDTPAAVRVEARCLAAVTTSLVDAFEGGNNVVNKFFFELIPDAVKRFGKQEST